MRIIIYLGSVVAWIIGTSRFITTWDDTMNAASRMQSQDKEVTYNLFSDRFNFESQGIMKIKSK